MSNFGEKTDRQYYSQEGANTPGLSHSRSWLLANNSQGSRASGGVSHDHDGPYDFGVVGDTAGARDSHASWGNTISDKLTLPADPAAWSGAGYGVNDPEADDALHDPAFNKYRTGRIFSMRGLVNVGCLLLLGLALIALFLGFPVITAVLSNHGDLNGGFNLGGINGSGQVPDFGNYRLIDTDTPQSAYSKKAYNGGGDMELVFSDEFNQDGRSFYPGDDPFWEAVDLHYWATNNLEWYDPEAVTTANGALEITLSAKQTHDLNYQGGMIQTWNKFCYTGGLLEASVTLPGPNNVHGLWPAIWSMGNLGRAGYGASLEGTWPYSYDSCDVGAAPNQTINGQPQAALQDGDPSANNELSWLPGQRLSRCVCAGESHPGPKHSDGSFVGRAAPEIDMFEAQITDGAGAVSQSAQWAPFNHGYIWLNTSDNLIIPNPSISKLNTYVGASLQQATSVVTNTNPDCYDQGGSGCFAIYGFEYVPGFDNAYITWVNDGQVAWTINSAGMAADSTVGIAARPVPQEPMYILMNLGMSTNFGQVDLAHLTFPTKMRVDWIRVYQPKGQINVGCDPKNFPTTDYINQYITAYTNPNLTTWRDDFKQTFPKNRIAGDC